MIRTQTAFVDGKSFYAVFLFDCISAAAYREVRGVFVRVSVVLITVLFNDRENEVVCLILIGSSECKNYT